MDPSQQSIRQQFVETADEWLRRLRRGERPSIDEAADPRRVVNLGHRLSDTLPGDLPHRLEAFVDEFWALCQGAWPDRPGDVAVVPEPERLERLAAAWRRLRRDLDPD